MKFNFFISTFFLLTFNVKCQNISNKQPEKKITNLTKTTTLDSLQGIWISTSDKNSRIKISNDTVYDFYNGKVIDKSIIYLSPKRTKNKVELDKKKKNGSFLILFSIDDNDEEAMCYWIDYLTGKRLILDYNGKANGYFKSK